MRSLLDRGAARSPRNNRAEHHWVPPKPSTPGQYRNLSGNQAQALGLVVPTVCAKRLMGVLRVVEWPPFEEQSQKQREDARSKLGDGDLAKLLASGKTWTVK